VDQPAGTSILAPEASMQSEENTVDDLQQQVSLEDLLKLKAFFGLGLYHAHHSSRDAIAQLVLRFMRNFVDETKSLKHRSEAYLKHLQVNPCEIIAQAWVNLFNFSRVS
jgi:hypothetical protein